MSNTTRLLGVPENATITFVTHLSRRLGATNPRPHHRELAINPPIISFSSLRNFNWGPVTIPIQIDGAKQFRKRSTIFLTLCVVWFLFDNTSGLIAQYDITFRRLEWAWDYIKPFLQPVLKQELGSLADNCTDVDDLMHLRAAIDVCQQHELYCLGSLQQYNSTQTCIDYVYRQTPLGKVYQWGGNTGERFLHPEDVQCSQLLHAYTAMCRYIHKGDSYRRSFASAFTSSAHLSSGMIPYRPAVHCPHIGYVNINSFRSHANIRNSPSGGGMCVERNVCIASSFGPHHADILWQQYINETTENLYPIPFLPLALG